MSWSARTQNAIDKDDLANVKVVPQTAPPGCADAYAEQRTAAFQAVKILAAAVGGRADQVYVTISGHANPNHEPCKGWAPEAISITVSAREAP